MSSDRLLRIHSAGFQAMAERVRRVTELTSRLNVLPFTDEVGKAELFEEILGRPLPARVTIYPQPGRGQGGQRAGGDVGVGTSQRDQGVIADAGEGPNAAAVGERVADKGVHSGWILGSSSTDLPEGEDCP